MSYFKNLNIRNEKILKAKTKELEKLDEFKSQFFTNISHEIRTPLTIINGQISELEGLAITAPEVVDIQKGIKKQIRNITNMVDDVLDLAKMESSNFNLQLQPVNISKLLHKQYLSFEPLYKQKGIAFIMMKNAEDYIAKIDTVFFEKAVNNIIVNALKYTDTGEVSITISQQNQSLCIAISDTGIGIASKDIDSVFNRFYQVNNDINKSGGSGIGLAFSKEIIELHRGNFLLDSELGKGSTFTILIPLEKTQPAALEIALVPVEEQNVHIQRPIDGESAPKFLIAEDNYDMRKYLVSILPDYTCLEASNGLEALEIIEQERIDFVITDYMMPKLNGHEFIEKLKVDNSTIPVIMLTAKTDSDTKLDVLKLGIDDYITKPFEKQELLVRINNCLRNTNDRNTYNKKNGIKVEDDKDDFIIKLKEYVYNKSHDIKLNQDVLSEEFHLSKSSFYRKVKSQTGLSPNNFIKEIRLQKAHNILMKTPDILVKQLAMEVGFSHQAYFSKMYADRFGVKPRSRVLK
ncbi:MAG: response regulator [Maribacter dokdonensis]|uniref:response regulator n=1 Tax=Maribacter dokdonensis TaxID=320912 RepID=UPI0032984C8D